MGKVSGPGAKDRVGSLFSLRPLFGVQLKSNIKVLVGGGGGGGGGPGGGGLSRSNRDWAAACVPVEPGGAAGPVLPVPADSPCDHPGGAGGVGGDGGGVGCTLTSLLTVFTSTTTSTNLSRD